MLLLLYVAVECALHTSKCPFLGQCRPSGVLHLAPVGLFKNLKPLPTLKNPVVSH